MAVFRQIHISFWQDDFVLNLTPEEKYFYLYLMTNSKTTQCGIYELPKKIIEFETGYNRETVDKLLTRFIEYGKILYSESTNEIMLINWIKHNATTSPKVIKRIEKELKEVKNSDFLKKFDRVCIRYGYPMDTEPQKEKEEQQEKEPEPEEKVKTPYAEIVNLYNEICISLPKVVRTTDNRKTHIKARWKEYGDIETFKTLFTKAEQSDFLTHRKPNDRNWKADFDWLINQQNMAKVLEDKYINKEEPKKPQQQSYPYQGQLDPETLALYKNSGD